jgi:hypothetical protein
MVRQACQIVVLSSCYDVYVGSLLLLRHSDLPHIRLYGLILYPVLAKVPHLPTGQ